MTNKTLKILLGIIAVNLTLQTVKDVGLFPTAYAQDYIPHVQRVAICDPEYPLCAKVMPLVGSNGQVNTNLPALITQ